MAIHTQLPIHKKGIELLSLAFRAQVQMPRGVKRSLGDKDHLAASRPRGRFR